MEKSEKISDTVSSQLSPVSANSENSSNSSGYSTELSVNQSKSTEESNEKLIEEALNSPKTATAPELGQIKPLETTEPAVESFENFEKFRESFEIPKSESPEILTLDQSGSDSVSGSSDVSQTKIQTSSPVLAGSEQMKSEVKEEKQELSKSSSAQLTEVILKTIFTHSRG